MIFLSNFGMRIVQMCVLYSNFYGTWNVYSASHTKHNLPYKMVVCTWVTIDREFTNVTAPYI